MHSKVITCILLLVLTSAGAGFFLKKIALEQTVPVSEVVSLLPDTDPITEFRTEREQLRQMQISQLNEIIHGGNASEEIISLAQRNLLEIMRWRELETTLEGVLSLRSFQDVVVTVHTESVNVMVRSEILSEQECTVILELVTRETGISAGNVKIIPIN